MTKVSVLFLIKFNEFKLIRVKYFQLLYTSPFILSRQRQVVETKACSIFRKIL